MKRRDLLLLACAPALVYAGLAEAMYRLWDAGVASSSGPTVAQIVGGLVGALLVAPGNALVSYEAKQQVLAALGYAEAKRYGPEWRWFDFHVPMLATTAALFALSLAVVIAIHTLARRTSAAV